MPLVEINNDEQHIKLCGWHITESLHTLLSLRQLEDCELSEFQSISNESRKKQWLACRLCLHSLIPHKTFNILHTTNGKPYILPKLGNISFTHTSEYAVVAINTKSSIGIDVERIQERIKRIRWKFMSPSEITNSYGKYEFEKYCVYWSAKESLYKYTTLNRLDFTKSLLINKFRYQNNKAFQIIGYISTARHHKQVRIKVIRIEDHILTYTL